ncbi:MAG: insulinase family protein [Spirochaetota bacterium]
MKNTTIHGFEPISTSPLQEYRSEGRLYRHQATGCEVYHVHNEDPENVFAFAFKTPPADSSGIAHILEHTVLCGSKRYPLKDPFLVLMRGSMNTFLNAMTFPDKTVYPAASPVEADLFNIMKVYGDAVFFPLIRPEMFAQEGHRIQFDENGALERTGVVYNEMKGNYSTHDSIAEEWSLRSLLPDTPYGHDSGGDPQVIPSLDYERFVDFHRRYYHPQNARIFLYGNIETERYLEFLEEEFLSAFDPVEPGEVPIARQPRWSEPVRLTKTYPIDNEEEESRSSVTLNWLLPPVTDSFQTLAFEVLSAILLGHSGSPLYRAIAESPLGEDLSAPTGLETELLEMGFSVGMRGTEAERAPEIEELILGELRRLVREGIESELVTAALRSVEFRNREIRGGPFGLRLMRRSLRGWLHGEAPEKTLEFTRVFESLRERIEREPRFFESLIEQHLLENPHRSTLIVEPDAEEAQRHREAEESELREKLEQMDEAEKQRVREKQERLSAIQSEPDAPEDIAKIPFLTVDDLPRTVESIPFDQQEAAPGVPLMTHELFTNGVVYLDVAFDLSHVPEHLQDYLTLYTSVATECGLTDMAYEDLARELATHAGGLSFRLDAGTRVEDENDIRRHLFVRLKALPHSLSDALSLLEGVFVRPDFGNHERLEAVLQELRNDFRSSVLPSGHSYVSLRSARGLSRTSEIEERWKGLSQLVFLEQLSNEPIDTVAGRLEELRRAVIRQSGAHVAVACEEDVREDVVSLTQEFVAGLPGETQAAEPQSAAPQSPAAQAAGPEPAALQTPEPQSPAATTRYESILVSASVNYVGASVEGAHVREPEHVPESVLAHLLRTGFLWEEIRMKGGAYGAMAGSRALERVFSFASYRDPQIAETIDAFRRGLEETSLSGVDRASLDLAIISGVGQDSRPLSPGQKCIVSLKRALYGISDELRQWNRDQLLGVEVPDVQEAARRLAGRFTDAHASVMGSRSAVEEAAEQYPGLLERTLELHL